MSDTLRAQPIAHAPVLETAVPTISSPIAALRRAIDVARTAAALNALSDRQLDDIGVERSEIRNVARGRV